MQAQKIHEEQMNHSIVSAKSDKFKALFFLADKFGSHRDVITKIINEKTEAMLTMDKKKALLSVLEKISTHRETLSSSISNKIDLLTRLNSSRAMPLFILAVGILLQIQGYCDDKSLGGLDSITSNVMQIVFGSVVRKSLLAMAAAWGVFQAVTSGSFKPVLFWGGIGLAIAYVPKLIEVIASVG